MISVIFSYLAGLMDGRLSQCTPCRRPRIMWVTCLPLVHVQISWVKNCEAVQNIASWRKITKIFSNFFRRKRE
ncbi:unnamed protein product [Cylicostephanus goldi]|uniref:Uncharacterized protein n=1 Tax=Cylicostephanus goldi TaxID=71465 RepID=A0A3P6RJD3_CYLGO|nr:unnamed protein product [Cylicostephanus goldi]